VKDGWAPSRDVDAIGAIIDRYGQSETEERVDQEKLERGTDIAHGAGM
jgi:hypothetical protein